MFPWRLGPRRLRRHDWVRCRYQSAKVEAGSTVLIYGAGGVGLSAVMAAALCGAQNVVVADPVAAKRELGLDLGATHALDPPRMMSSP